MKKVTDERIETRIRSLELSGDRLSLREELELSCLRELLGWRSGAEAQGPVQVPDKCPAEIRDLLAVLSEGLFDDDDAQIIWNACHAAILAAAPQVAQPVQVPECFNRLLKHAYGMSMGNDWNNGTMAGHHREALCKAVDDCRSAMLAAATPQSVQELLVEADEVKYPRAYVECLVFEITALRKLVAEQDQRLLSYAAVATKNAEDGFNQAITKYADKRGFSFQHGSIHAHFGNGDVLVGAVTCENGDAGICFAPVREKQGGVGTEYEWTKGKTSEQVGAVFVITSSNAEGLEVIQEKLAEAIAHFKQGC